MADETVTKEQVDASVAAWMAKEKERRELSEQAEKLADELMIVLEEKGSDHVDKGLEQALERAREAENAAAKKVAELQKNRNKLGIARARIIAAAKARDASTSDASAPAVAPGKPRPGSAANGLAIARVGSAGLERKTPAA